jgi:hypothetical protein
VWPQAPQPAPPLTSWWRAGRRGRALPPRPVRPGQGAAWTWRGTLWRRRTCVTRGVRFAWASVCVCVLLLFGGGAGTHVTGASGCLVLGSARMCVKGEGARSSTATTASARCLTACSAPAFTLHVPRPLFVQALRASTPPAPLCPNAPMHPPTPTKHTHAALLTRRRLGGRGVLRRRASPHRDVRECIPGLRRRGRRGLPARLGVCGGHGGPPLDGAAVRRAQHVPLYRGPERHLRRACVLWPRRVCPAAWGRCVRCESACARALND